MESGKKNAIVVGGTSGLGLEMAKLLQRTYGYTVQIAGRTDPKEEGLSFRRLRIGSDL